MTSNQDLKIIYQDADILVLDKPAGLIVESQKENQETLENILKKDFKIDLTRGGIVHRLDKGTSGIVIVAKNEKALVALQNQFATRSVKKVYYTLVLGKLEPKQGRIELALKRDPKNRVRFIASRAKDAREAITEYTAIEYILGAYGLTFLKAIPLTGRTHQIRAHFFAIGHPVVGDKVYKNARSEEVCQKLGLGRQFLHAAEISFKHPTTGKIMSFKTDLPEDLKAVLDKIQKQK